METGKVVKDESIGSQLSRDYKSRRLHIRISSWGERFYSVLR